MCSASYPASSLKKVSLWITRNLILIQRSAAIKNGVETVLFLGRLGTHSRNSGPVKDGSDFVSARYPMAYCRRVSRYAGMDRFHGYRFVSDAGWLRSTRAFADSEECRCVRRVAAEFNVASLRQRHAKDFASETGITNIPK
jgi:hypothetical protein